MQTEAVIFGVAVVLYLLYKIDKVEGRLDDVETKLEGIESEIETDYETE